MKNIKQGLVSLLKEGYCAPRIVSIAKKLKEPSPTIHYNLKQLEKDKVIRSYKAVFDYNLIDEGFCNYVLINLAHNEYGNPERVGSELLNFPQIESIDIVSGEWEMLIKVRTKNVEEFYQFIKNVLSKNGIIKTNSLASLKQLKTEFITL